MTDTSPGAATFPPARTPGDFKALRERLGLPARWLAEELGLQDRQVRRWEQGVAEIPASAWECLIDIYVQSIATEQEVLREVRDHPNHPLHAPRNDQEFWRDSPGFKIANLPASHYRAILARVSEKTGVSLYYNPEPIPESLMEADFALRGSNLDKYYPAFMEGGPFDGRELSIEFEPPHPRWPFAAIPFASSQPGAPSYHYKLVPSSTVLAANGYDVIESRYVFVGYDL